MSYPKMGFKPEGPEWHINLGWSRTELRAGLATPGGRVVEGALALLERGRTGRRAAAALAAPAVVAAAVVVPLRQRR